MTHCSTGCLTGVGKDVACEPSADAAAVDYGLYGRRTWCSRHDGSWRSVLLRDLVSVPEVDDAEVPPCHDQTIVLVVRGGKRIESRAGGRIRRATYGPGTIALTAPGTTGRFSWRSQVDAPQRALHLQIPAHTMASAVVDIGAPLRLPNTLSARDPVLEHVVRALEVAGRAGADDLYAESAAVFLAAHLVSCA